MNKKKVLPSKMTPERFELLSYEEKLEFLSIYKTDYEVVKDLIRDRNEFRLGYIRLFKQLKALGVEPDETYYLKGLYHNV